MELGTSWMADAACRGIDPESFFTPDAGDNAAALAACAACPVTAQCVEYAIRTRATGIWGGTTDTQRDRMRRTTPATQRPAYVDRDARYGCGTPAGYMRHLRNKTALCDPCRKAERLRKSKYAGRSA